MKLNIFNQYVTEVAHLYNLEEELIFEKSKERGIVDARHLLYYLCYFRPMKLKYIQDYMKGRGYEIGHSSIIHGIQSVQKAIDEDDDYQSVINQIKNK
tara:strand:- start:130 stop:423 length:294 start_codon:yes stop_codon:yes gene_type:complete